MKTVTNEAGASLHYEDIGIGTCVLALHGAYSAHEEILAFLEPILDVGHRRLYPDLPGMGATPAHDSIQSSNDVVDLLDELIRAEIGAEPFLVVGQSYGAHIARGIAARRPDQVVGLALICPLMPDRINSEPHVVIHSSGSPTQLLDPAEVDEYTGYFVIHTPETAARFREAVTPVMGRWAGAAVVRVMNDSAIDPDPDATRYERPTLVLTGRHDSYVGYRDQLALLDIYPRARYVAFADAGHALPHEHPQLLAGLIGLWLGESIDKS